MRILVSNDDGIDAAGFRTLVEIASAFGTVYAAAPAGQCSAMSQKINIHDPIRVQEEAFSPAVKAWRIFGTPADSVKIALRCLLEEKPDLVLSGVNYGCNVGFDIPYSGTVGAAMEGLMNGIPAIAVSAEGGEEGLATVRAVVPGILKNLLAVSPGKDCIYNINIPPLPPDKIKGIRYGVKPAPYVLYKDGYTMEKNGDGSFSVRFHGQMCTAEETWGDNDAALIMHGYVTVGTVKNMAL